MTQVLKVMDGSKEVYRFRGDLNNFNLKSFDRWLKSQKFTTSKKNLVKWCFASLMYGMAIRFYLS